jgi:hypothetical protein
MDRCSKGSFLTLALLGIVALFGVTGSASDSSAATDDQPTIEYFALGDSIASGHGLHDEDGIQGVYDDPWRCRQSPRIPGDSRMAYPYYAADALQAAGYSIDFPREHHLACTGARAGDPGSDSHPYKHLANQVDHVLDTINEQQI